MSPEKALDRRLTLLYWKSDRFWLGKLLERPDIMTQGKTIQELEENIRDAYLMLALEDVPADYQVKKIAV
jgi:predicted RNase H-like HicB family nuclease